METEQANVEYFFRLLYNLFFGAGAGLDYSAFLTILSRAWLWVSVIGYGVATAGLFIIIFATMRLFDLRKREEEFYNTLLVAPSAAGDTSPRWQHIQSLMEGSSKSEWREAITEADIMLDDALARRDYAGEGVGDKLKNIQRGDLATLDDAWEAHKVRNQIAHEGSAFDLSEELAHRTMQRYESVFRELSAI